MKSKDGKGGFVDTLLRPRRAGCDPNHNLRVSVEKPEWYRFDGTLRKFATQVSQQFRESQLGFLVPQPLAGRLIRLRGSTV